MIKTKKLNDISSKRIIKSNNTTEDVEIVDVPNNVIENGTAITDSVLESINYKDDKSLEFSITNSHITPPIGKAVIYSKEDGKIYFNVSGYQPVEISSNQATEIIKKKGITYVPNGKMEYFNLGSSMNLFSTGTKIGTIPRRNEETNIILDATYFDITDDEIEAYICGNTKMKIQQNNIRMTNMNSKIEMNSASTITLSSNDTKLEIRNDRFYIKNQNTDIGIDSNINKLNCHTDLPKASYGNNKYRIQMENDLKIRDIENNNTLLSINQNGEIMLGNKTLERYIRDIASSEARRIKEFTEIFNGKARYVYDYFLNNYNYVFYFSDSLYSDTIMSFEINGQNIEDMINNKIYISKTNAYYYLVQEIAEYDDDQDILFIYKYKDGVTTNIYFRQIYKEYN